MFESEKYMEYNSIKTMMMFIQIRSLFSKLSNVEIVWNMNNQLYGIVKILIVDVDDIFAEGIDVVHNW